MKWKVLENEIAKALSTWMFGDPKILRRTPCSGGWKGRGTGVDITLVDDREDLRKYDMFAYEVKCRVCKGRSEGGWHFEQLLTSKKHPILAWWRGLCDSDPVKKGKKMRLLIFSKTAGVASSYVAFGEAEHNFLQSSGVPIDAVPTILFSEGRCEDPKFRPEIIRLCHLRAFLSYVDAGKLKSAWEKRQ
jgi:hypothetical protein